VVDPLLAYSTGMRLQEVCNCKLVDIDSKNMCIRVVKGKAKKDRLVSLHFLLLVQLREYYKQYRPKEYLFSWRNDN
jgi:integrase/recombinase XerD